MRMYSFYPTKKKEKEKLLDTGKNYTKISNSKIGASFVPLNWKPKRTDLSNT